MPDSGLQIAIIVFHFGGNPVARSSAVQSSDFASFAFEQARHRRNEFRYCVGFSCRTPTHFGRRYFPEAPFRRPMSLIFFCLRHLGQNHAPRGATTLANAVIRRSCNERTRRFLLLILSCKVAPSLGPRRCPFRKDFGFHGWKYDMISFFAPFFLILQIESNSVEPAATSAYCLMVYSTDSWVDLFCFGTVWCDRKSSANGATRRQSFGETAKSPSSPAPASYGNGVLNRWDVWISQKN